MFDAFQQWLNPELRRLLRGFGFLYLLQVSNVVLPIIAIGILTRILGPDGYGRLAYAQVIALQIGLVVDFGFELYGTREIARRHSSGTPISELSGDILIARTLLLAVCASSLPVVSLIVGTRMPLEDLFAAYLAVVATALFPTWHLQGTERMGWLFCTLASGKLIGVVWVLFLVSAQPNVSTLLAALNMPSVVMALVVTYLLVKRGEIAVSWRPHVGRLKVLFEGAASPFLTVLLFHSYKTTNLLVLGLLVPASVFALFSAADKVIGGVRALTGPLLQGGIPAVARASRVRAGAPERLIQYGAGTAALVFLPVSVAIVAWPEEPLEIFFGAAFIDAAPYLSMMAPIPLVVAVAHCFSSLGLFALGYTRHWIAVVGSTAVLNVGLVWAMLLYLPAPEAIAAALVIDELWALLFGWLLFNLVLARKRATGRA